MREEYFYFLRELFNALDLKLTPSNIFEQEALDALDKVKELFNKDFYSVTLEDFESMATELEYVQDRMELFKGISEKAKMN